MRSSRHSALLPSKFLMGLIAAWLVAVTGLPAMCQTAVYQVNSGGGAASPFIADQYYSGGSSIVTTSTTIDTSGITNPAPQAVYQTQRYTGGNFTYTFPTLTPGAAYTVRLHFAEIYGHQPGQSPFWVSINGTQALNSYDVAAAAGAPNKAVVTAFNTTADSNGNITAVFSSPPAYAICNGIEILGGNQAITSAPTGLKAVPLFSAVSLSWQALSGATSYNLLRSASTGGPFVRINPNIITGTTYTDTGLTNLTYYYQVLAANASGEGPASPYVSAQPPILSVTPSNITVVRGSSVALTIGISDSSSEKTNVSLKVSGMPTGITAWCYPSACSLANPVTLPKVIVPTDGANSVLNIAVGNNVTPGTYQLTLTGNVNKYSASVSVTLTVN